MNIRLIWQDITCFAMLFLAVALVGCGVPVPTASPTLQATTNPEPTSAPSHLPTPTQAIISRRLTNTPTVTATIDLTQVATYASLAPSETAERLSMNLTQNAVSTLNAIFPESCGYEYPSVSPDGNWLADDCSEFHVSSRDGQKQIVITHEELSPPDMPVSIVYPTSWSKDSQYLYFYTGFCCLDSDVSSRNGPLYRLELQSSKWVKMMGGDGFANSYSFSPTDRRVLHIPAGGNPVKLHVVDLKSGAEQWLQLQNFDQVWGTQWSPDGMRFAIVGKNGSIITGDAQYALFIVSLTDLSITQLIPLSDHDVYPSNWSDDDVLTVDSCFYDGQDDICKQLLYNIKAK